MTTHDPVPEADRLEQQQPAVPSGRPLHRGGAETPEADAFEQELPLADAETDEGIDAERREPLDDEPTTRG